MVSRFVLSLSRAGVRTRTGVGVSEQVRRTGAQPAGQGDWRGSRSPAVAGQARRQLHKPLMVYHKQNRHFSVDYGGFFVL